MLCIFMCLGAVVADHDNYGKMTDNKKAQLHLATLVSPFIIIGLGFIVATLSYHTTSQYAWLPPMIFYWAILFWCIVFLRGLASFKFWLKKSEGGFGWRLLSLLTPAFVIIPTMLYSKGFSFDNPTIVVGWVMIVILNPIVEEAYWRAILTDATHTWKGWQSVFFTSIVFGLSHPLIMGINIPLVSGITGFIGTFVNGIIWALVYYKTKSLRWGIASHMVTNFFSIGIFFGVLKF